MNFLASDKANFSRTQNFLTTTTSVGVVKHNNRHENRKKSVASACSFIYKNLIAPSLLMKLILFYSRVNRYLAPTWPLQGLNAKLTLFKNILLKNIYFSATLFIKMAKIFIFCLNYFCLLLPLLISRAIDWYQYYKLKHFTF